MAVSTPNTVPQQKLSLKDIIKLEYIKCSQDPIHFMKKYCVIQHPKRGKIPFHLFPFQEDTLTQFSQNRYNIVLKSRQTGISTLVAGYSLWKMIFNEDFNVLVIATQQEVAKNLVTKVRVMNDFLPSWLKQISTEDNKLSLKYANGSQIKAISSTGNAGRSEALSLLVFDEAAFIDKIEEIWISSQSTLSTGGDAIILSTPNGVGNFFHKTWVKAQLPAEEGDVKFNSIKLHWSVHPERDQVWRNNQEVLLGAKGAAQECDCNFNSSGDTVIDPELLHFYEETFVKEPLEKSGVDGNLWRWEYPDPHKAYMVIADVSRGDSSDYSACHVIEIESVTQVAEYKGKMTTTDFGNFLVALATEYNDALLVVENANIGWAAIQQVINRNYGNLF
jgi:DNA-binding protein